MSKTNPTTLDLVTIRSLVTRETRRGIYWRCNLCYKGRVVATLENGGDGGATRIVPFLATPGAAERVAEIAAAAATAIGDDFEALDGMVCAMTPGMTGTEGVASYLAHMAAS